MDSPMAATQGRRRSICATSASKSSRLASGTGTSGNFTTWRLTPKTRLAISWTRLKSSRRWLAGPCTKARQSFYFTAGSNIQECELICEWNFTWKKSISMIVDRNNKPSAVKASISVDMLIKCAFAYSRA